MLWILLSLTTILLFYIYLIKPQLYWKRKNVKQGPPKPLMGDFLRNFIGLESMIDMVKRIYNLHKDGRYYGMYQTTLPTLMIRDPELIKQITVKDFEHFVDHRSFTQEVIEPIWTKNLFALKGEAWRDMRSTLSPTFTASKMRAMFVLMEKSAQQYVDFYLNQNKNIIELDLKDSFTRFANDVIANCAFGITVDSLKEPENTFYVNGREATNLRGFWPNFKFLINIMAPKIAIALKLSLFSANVTTFFKSIIHDTVKIREEQNICRPDMINLLMEARKGKLQYEDSNDDKDAGFATVQESEIGKNYKSYKHLELTEMDMAAQVLIFFFAGFETISSMMSFMYYELALNPEIQAKLRKEIDETYKANQGKLTYDILGKMKYLDMVLSESLRKHPPAVAVDRVCTKSYTIAPIHPNENPVHLKPGDLIWLPIIALHNDERFFPNPSKFDPDRFSDANKENIQAYSYIPFGSGPRNCIGSRFALMEVKTLIFHIMSRFEVVVIDKTVIPIKLQKRDFNPTMEGGCWVGFKRRTDYIKL